MCSIDNNFMYKSMPYSSLSVRGLMFLSRSSNKKPVGKGVPGTSKVFDGPQIALDALSMLASTHKDVD